jgi:hypothetical protein
VDVDELERRIRRLEELERLRSEPWPDPEGAAVFEIEIDQAAASWTSVDLDPLGDAVSPNTPFEAV